jgi:hypothetical protein
MKKNRLTTQGRRREPTWSRVLLITIALGLAAPSSAHAYLDPATGSILIQVAMAAAAGTAYFVRRYWNRLKSLLGIKSAETTGDDESVDG